MLFAKIMYIRSTILMLCILSALFAGNAAAGPGVTGMDFLRIGTGARQAGMGGAAVALADDIFSMYYNPAGLALLEKNEVSFVHLAWFESINYEYLSFVVPSEKFGAFGGNVSLLHHGGIQGYNAGGTETETVYAYDLAVTLTASRSVSRWDRGGRGLFAGANLKLVQEALGSVSATTLAVDIGGLYAPDWDVAGGEIRFGACVENAGLPVKFIQDEASLPLNLRFGAAYERRVPGGSICMAVDGNTPFERDFYFCAGTEYLYSDLIALRIGYSSENNMNNGFSCGIGIRGGSDSGFIFQFDHAVVPYGRLGNTHRMSIRLCF